MPEEKAAAAVGVRRTTTPKQKLSAASHSTSTSCNSRETVFGCASFQWTPRWQTSKRRFVSLARSLVCAFVFVRLHYFFLSFALSFVG